MTLKRTLSWLLVTLISCSTLPVWAQLPQAETAYRDHNYAQALELYRKSLKQQPQESTRLQILRTLVKLKRYDDFLSELPATLAALKTPRLKAQALHLAAQTYAAMPHEGFEREGKVYRDTTRREGQFVWLYEEDRTQAESYYLQARQAYAALLSQTPAASAPTLWREVLAFNQDLGSFWSESFWIDGEPKNWPKLSVPTRFPVDWPREAETLTKLYRLHQENLWLARQLKDPHSEVVLRLGWAQLLLERRGLDAKEYPDSDPLQQLLSLAREFPQDPLTPEVRLLSGDVYDARGEHTRALEIWQGLASTSVKDHAAARIQQLTWPQLNLSTPGAQAPNTPARFQLGGRNLKTVRLQLRRIPLPEILQNPLNLSKPDLSFRDLPGQLGNRYAALATAGEAVLNWEFQPRPATPYTAFNQELKLPQAVPAGAYLLLAETDTVRAAQLVVLSDLVLSSRQDPTQTLYYLSHAATGQPVSGAKLYIKERVSQGGQQQVRPRELRTDAQGMARFAFAAQPSDSYRQFEALAVQGEHYALSNMAYASQYGQEQAAWRVYSYSDRPLYRPGQTVYLRQLLRRQQEGRFTAAGDQALELVISDPRGETVSTQTLKPNRFGSLNAELKLPENAPLGAYRLGFRLPGSGTSVQASGALSFQVEAYRKPEFEVSVLPQTTVPGEQARATVRARYLFGGPVSQGQVQLTVRRRDYQPFWEDRPYWGRWEAPREEVVSQSSGSLNAQGEWEVTFPTQANSNSVYTLEAEVTDASRREVVQSATLTVTEQAFFARIELDQGFYQAGDRVSAEIGLRDANGQPVPAQSGTVIVERLSAAPQAQQPDLAEEIWRTPATSDAEGRIFVRWPSKEGGKYRLRFEARDRREKAVQAEQVFWITGKGFEGRHLRLNGVELLTDKREYAPGESVELLVQADAPDSHVWLTHESDDAIFKSELLALKGRSQVVRFPLSESHQPNFMLRALTVHDRTVHSDERELFVPALQHRLQVRLTPDRSRYAPGETAGLQIEVRDAQQRPVETELSLALVDKALYQLLPDSTPAIHTALYGQRRQIPQRLEHSLSVGFNGFEETLLKAKEYRLKPLSFDGPGSPVARAGGPRSVALPAPQPAAEMAADRDQEGFAALRKSEAAPADAVAPPRVRSEFKDTAYWNPSVITDAQGRARLQMELPDNLTTWRLNARGWDAGTRVGEQTQDLLVQQDLMLRLQQPRFLVEGDSLLLSANLTNATDQSETATVSLKLDPRYLESKVELTRQVTLPPRGEARVDWQVRVAQSGDTTIEAEARGSRAADAVRQSLPIKVYGSLRREVHSGSVGSRSSSAPERVTQTLNLPSARLAEQTRLRISLQPSLAATLLDALPYLLEYPYGCMEQTTSRFVPAVLVARTLNEQGLSLADLGKQLQNDPRNVRGLQPLQSQAELDRLIADGLSRLSSGQNPDGGWGWWPGGQSDPYISTYVLDALQLAQQADLKVDEPLLRQGLAYLTTAFAENRQPQLKAYQALVLARAGRLKANAMQTLFDGRDALNPYGMGLLALAHHHAGAPDKAQLILSNLKSFVRRDASTQTASWDNKSPSWYWYGDRVETNATLLQAFVAISPQDALVPEIMRWLVFNRQGNRWYSTKDTSRAIAALSAYLRSSGELKADFGVSVRLNGKEIHQQRFTPAQALAGAVTLDLPDSALQTGANQLELVKTGAGTLYYSQELQVFSREAKIAAAGNQLSVQRRYFKVVDTVANGVSTPVYTPLAEGALVTSGEEVEVRLEITSPNDYEYLLFEDFKPAGFEAVDTLSGYVSQNGTGVYRELRDDRVALFLGSLPQGTQVLSYRLRAETPGRFHALPHRAEAMYAPQIQATSDSMVLGVQDRE